MSIIRSCWNCVEIRGENFCYVVVSFDLNCSVLFIEIAWMCLLLARSE